MKLTRALRLRYLCDAEVAAVMPAPAEVVRLAEQALIARAEGAAQVPPKPAVHFGRNGFANAMPVAVGGSHEPGLLGCKWISLQPENPARDLPTAAGIMIVCDGETGMPTCLMSAGELTAVRTAAVSAACLRAFVLPDEPVTFIGAGTQALSHLRILTALGYRDLRIVGRRPEPRRALEAAADELAVADRVTVTEALDEAVRSAAAIITGLPIGLRGTEIDARLVRQDALLLPLDYASSIGADLAATATVTSDDVEQFTQVAPAKLGADYPAATEWTGNAIRQPRPPGRVLMQNLGNASSDILLAAAIAEAAEAASVGTLLSR